MKLVAYIRGGLGDVFPAVSSIKSIVDKYEISKFDITIITDSVYYFRDNYPKSFEEFSLGMIRKLTSNIVMVPPWINNNFNLNVDEKTNGFSQENADRCVNEFLFWRPQSLKEFVRKHIGIDTIFIDSIMTECIMKWNFQKGKYERVSKDRGTFEFNPSGIEKKYIDKILKGKNILIHIRKKHGNYGKSPEDEFYTNIIKFCNDKGIKPIVIGVEIMDIKGDYIDLVGRNPLSFEGMAYLIDKCDIMLGNDSGLTMIKLFQQQKDKLTIINYPTRWDRSFWMVSALEGKSNFILLNAQEDNIEEIKKLIGGD